MADLGNTIYQIVTWSGVVAMVGTLLLLRLLP
jgi:hypothetical protein